jgi:hypothetical protein
VSFETVRDNEDFQKTIMKDLYALADSNKFNSLEKPK